MNKQALLNVAIANERTPHRESFDMTRFVHPCGTPACALGNYIADPEFAKDHGFGLTTENARGSIAGKLVMPNGDKVLMDDKRVQSHFDLTSDQMEELFGEEGCCTASWPEEAAAYIRQFVADHE